MLALSLGALLVSLLGTVTSSSPRLFLGWSASVVLTGSMQDVYPQGSLVVTKSVDSGELGVGDDITYMASNELTYTHRIVGIYEPVEPPPDVLNTLPEDKRTETAFQTQGTMNATPDAKLVYASNVVGKVVFSSLFLGQLVTFVRTGWPLIFVLLALALLTRQALACINREETEKDKEGDFRLKGRLSLGKGGIGAAPASVRNADVTRCRVPEMRVRRSWHQSCATPHAHAPGASVAHSGVDAALVAETGGLLLIWSRANAGLPLMRQSGRKGKENPTPRK